MYSFRRKVAIEEPLLNRECERLRQYAIRKTRAYTEALNAQRWEG